MPLHSTHFFFFFFNDTATTEIYTLSLHDALPILILRKPPRSEIVEAAARIDALITERMEAASIVDVIIDTRSEEHTSELQSQSNLVCRLLLEKKKKAHITLQAVHRDIVCKYCQLE